MNRTHNQRGITLSGFIMTCIVLGVVAVFGMKLFPLYNEKMKVDQAMDKLAQAKDGERLTKAQMVKAMKRQFEVTDVDRFDTPTLTKTLKVGRKKGTNKKVVSLTYEIRGPLFSNLDVVMNYDKAIEFGATQTD